jgi:hypothetical protein
MEPGMRVPVLPPQFGRNQVLEVPDRTRALLEEIAAGFDAPIRYAFAYGSGVFNQDGYKDSVSIMCPASCSCSVLCADFPTRKPFIRPC